MTSMAMSVRSAPARRHRFVEAVAVLGRFPHSLQQLLFRVAVAMGATFELGCSALLIVGLGTRLATLPLLGMLTVIQLFVYPNAWADHLTWGSILIALLTRGAGAASLDRLFGLERPEDASLS